MTRVLTWSNKTKTTSSLTKDIIHQLSKHQSFWATPRMGQMLTVSMLSSALWRDENKSDPRINIRGLELLGSANKADTSVLLETVSRDL